MAIVSCGTIWKHATAIQMLEILQYNLQPVLTAGSTDSKHWKGATVRATRKAVLLRITVDSKSGYFLVSYPFSFSLTNFRKLILKWYHIPEYLHPASWDVSTPPSISVELSNFPFSKIWLAEFTSLMLPHMDPRNQEKRQNLPLTSGKWINSSHSAWRTCQDVVQCLLLLFPHVLSQLLQWVTCSDRN